MRSIVFGLTGLGISLVCAACPGLPEPKPPVWEDGRPHVTVIQGANEPLVVDWQPEQRGDLEVSMKQGVAVVAYDKSGLKLLRDCKIDGSYGFFGTTTKEQVVRLQSEDELRANLPTFGGLLAAKLGGEMKQGGTLDVALVMVGKLRTTWHRASRGDLSGECAAATHFVRGATVGAFAMDQGSSRSTRLAAEIFSVGASASSSNSKQVRNTDGSAAACKESDPDAPRAPKQCGALLRIELTEIAAGTSDSSPKEKDARPITDADRCVKPLVFADGKCALPKAEEAHECRYGEGAECVAECKKANLESCARLSHMLLTGKGVTEDLSAGVQLARMACEKGHARACVIAAQALLNTPKIKPDHPAAASLAKTACDRGDEQGCGLFGTLVGAGIGVPRDATQAARAFVKGCNGGVESSCSELGLLFERGDGVGRDDAKAAALHKRACDGEEMVGCVNFGLSLEFGSGVRKDVANAARFYKRACDGEPNYCIQMGAITLSGNGVKADTSGALGYFRKSCGAQHPVSCSFLNVFASEKHELDKVAIQQYLSLYKAGCKASVPRDCTGLAILGMAFGADKSETLPLLERGCTLGDTWGCTVNKAAQR